MGFDELTDPLVLLHVLDVPPRIGEQHLGRLFPSEKVDGQRLEDLDDGIDQTSVPFPSDEPARVPEPGGVEYAGRVESILASARDIRQRKTFALANLERVTVPQFDAEFLLPIVELGPPQQDEGIELEVLEPVEVHRKVDRLFETVERVPWQRIDEIHGELRPFESSGDLVVV